MTDPLPDPRRAYDPEIPPESTDDEEQEENAGSSCSPDDTADPQHATLFTDHDRRFQSFSYVYPVISRRAGGLSIGIDLSPARRCTFRCIYCQIDRSGAAASHPDSLEACGQNATIDLQKLTAELHEVVEFATSGEIFKSGRFQSTPEPMRRLNDIALSGSGEPTSSPYFADVCQIAATVRSEYNLDQLKPPMKIIVITNSTLLDRPAVQRGLEILDSAGGEIWAKLDAGTESYYKTISRSAVPLDRIISNIVEVAQPRPIIIQTLMMQIDGAAPTDEEIDAYSDRLREIRDRGGRIRQVHLHTIARPPAESNVAPLDRDTIEIIANRIRRRSKMPVAVFY